ncbi:protein OS-9-like [Liolophura sinensis]|uniref:protein OS-9-like n=1 Tax=Liolophura sinensis TaxID=3198878 RepID=UPI0031595D11
MATKTNCLLLVLSTLSSWVNSVGGFLDIDELKSIHYGIDILRTPVVLGKDDPPGAVYLQSKFGQQYQCSFPDHSQQEKQKQEEEKLAVEIGIPELLRPLETGPCLIKVKDWWTYEFCYGKHVRQYHLEDGLITGDIIYLGLFESEFDWNNNEVSSKNKNRLNRYHSQHYGNGSKCDLTQEPRKTEVRFLCEEGSGDYIARIDEPETCVYILTVHTTKICHHPDLRPKSHSHNVPIYCNPVITDAQYEQYLVDLEEERHREAAEAEARRVTEAEATRAAEVEAKRVADEQAKSVLTDPDDSTISSEGVRMQSKEDLTKLLDRVLHKQQQQQQQQVVASGESPVVDVDNKNPTTVKDGLPSQPKGDGSSTSSTGEKADEEEEDVHVDQQLLEEFNQGLDDIAGEEGEKAALALMKDEIRQTMESQFNDIIKEAQDELGTDDMDVEERKVAFKHLSETLAKLIKKVQRTGKEIEDATKAVDALNTVTNTNTEDEQLVADSSEDSQKAAASETQTTSDKAALKFPVSEDDSDRVKVRITRIKSSPKDDDLEQDEDSSKKHMVETTIQDELKKAGLDTEGGKIHVKIITAGYYDTDKNSVHVLSEEDSEAFNKMIVAILGGNNEAAKEAEKHKQLEDNYNLVWEKDNRKSKKP